MDIEFQALTKNQTWSLVPPSPFYNLVGNKWVFRIKYNSDGSINHYKARLVAKGFHQTLGIDFSKTYSPVVKSSAIHILLTLAISFDWFVHQFDINNTFLNGYLQEIVCKIQLEGFINLSKPNYVCKLHRALYRLKQTP